MNRILALQQMSTTFVSDGMANSDESVKCSSASTTGCSSQSINCGPMDDSFALDW